MKKTLKKTPKTKQSNIKITTQEATITELKNQNLILQAEMDNLRKRNQKDLITARNHEKRQLLNPLLDLHHSLNLALNSLPTELKQDNWDQGLQNIMQNLEKSLQKLGLKPIETINQEFNPDLHEAISSASGKPNIIITETRTGWLLDDEVFRPAQVIVGQK